MSKRNKQAEINATKNKQGKPKLSDHLSQNDDLSGQIRSTGELSRIDYPDTVNNQTAVLGDSRLQKIQRQTIANQIGQTQGNRHLERVTTEATGSQELTPSNRLHNLPPIVNPTHMPIQLLRSGNVDAIEYNESPSDVIAIRMPYQIGSFETILENINRVVQQFGSSSRTYTDDINFQLMLRSFLQEISHPSLSGGGPVMTRQRQLRLRIRVVRGETRRIERISLLRPRTEVEVETPEVVEGRRPTEPERAREPTREIEQQAPSGEREAPAEQGGMLGRITSGAEALGNLTSGRWVWDPITGQLAEWEAELDRIGEQGSPTTLGSVLMVPVSLLFVILQSIVGLLDLLARLNPLSLALHGTATSVRAAAGQYTREDFMRDALEVGEEALDIITLGLRNAYRHLREGVEEANVFRITQAVGEIALAALAIFGVFRAIRIRSSAGRIATAVAEERAAPAAPAEPTTPGEPVRPSSLRESAPTGETVRPSAPIEQAPTESVRGTSPTEAAVRETARPSTPTEGAGAEPGRPTSPTESTTVRGRPGIERVYRTEEVARQIRNEYMSGETRGGWDAALSEESLQTHWEGVGGRGRPPLAFVDTNGHLVFDARRLGLPQEGMVAEGTARRMARRPLPSPRIQEPARATAPTEQVPAESASAEPVRGTAPTEAAVRETVRATAPTEAVPAEPVRGTTSTEAAVRETVRPTAPTESAPAEPVRGTAPTEAAIRETVRPTAPTETAPAEPVRGTAPTEAAVRETARPTASTEGVPERSARPTETAESAAARGRPQIERVFNTEEVAREVRDQYVSGEARGGWDAALSEESLQAHWEGLGGQGRAPLAFVDTNGHLVFDARRLGMSPERMTAEGTARRMARRPAPTSDIYEAITDPARARQFIQVYEQRELGYVRKQNAAEMQGAWEHAGGEGPAPVAYLNIHGGFVVNLEALRGQ